MLQSLKSQQILDTKEEIQYKPLLEEYRLKQICQWDAHSEIISVIKIIHADSKKFILTGSHDKLIKIWVFY